MASGKITLYKAKTETTPGTHPGNATEMNVPLEQLDKVGVYLNDKLISCAGSVSWDGAAISWSDVITIHFAGANGKTYENTIAAGSKALSDGDFAYVTLNEAASGPLTVATATPAAAADCNFLADEILVLGRRIGSKFVPVSLLAELASAGSVDGGVSLSYPSGDKPAASSSINILLPHALILPAGLTGSMYYGATAPTAQVVVSFQKNGSQFGTMTVETDNSVTFAAATQTALNPGDRLTFSFPATQDATWAGVSVTLKGTR